MMRRRGAFTLLELVVAMTIAGLIVVMAAVGLRMSVNSLRRGSAEAERLARLKATSYGIRVELASVHALPQVASPRPSAGAEVPVYDVLSREDALENPFFGGADEVQFVASRTVSAGVASPGLRRVRYFVRTEDNDDDEPPGLYKEVSPYFGAKAEERMAEADEEPAGKVEFLLDPDVVAMSIEYLNPAEEEMREVEEEAEAVEVFELEDGSEWVPDVPEIVNVTLDYGDEQVRISVQTGARYGPAAEELL